MRAAASDSTEGRLAESEERYRAVIENASDMVQSVLADGHFEFVNPAWLRTLGYAAEEVPGLIIWDVIHPESLAHCQPIFGRVMRGENVPEMELTFKAKDGTAIPVEGNATPRLVDGEVVATHSFFRDIRERRRAEELERRTIELERERTAQYLEKMAALGKLSAGLAHELNNPAAAARRAAGQLAEAVAKLDRLAIQLGLHGLDGTKWTRLQRMGEELLSRTARQVELGPLAESAREEALTSWLEGRGIDDARELAPSFARAAMDQDALDALCREFSTDSLGDALAWLSQSLAAREMLEVMDRSTARLSELVNAVKAYSFMDQAAEQFVDIHDGLENTLTIVGHRLHGVTVIREFDRKLPAVRVFGSGLNQVWTNLIENAIDATAGAGTVQIRTSRNERCIVVEIADGGIGIPADIQSRIFEPFFTTKAHGEGIGLGLNTVWRIVSEEYGGEIRVESKPGDTRFFVSLPIESATRPSGSTAAEK